MERQIDDPIAKVQQRFIDLVNYRLDGNIIIYGGSRRSYYSKLVAFAHEHGMPIILPTTTVVGDVRAELERRVNEVKAQLIQLDSKGRVSSEDMRLLHLQKKPGSRRGRNIKPDESRKARYSKPRNR